MKIHELITNLAEADKQRLDPKCWTGKHKEGTKIKGGVRVNNCVPNESVAEGLGKNVVKSIKVGNFRHDLVDTGMGWQVRIYNGDELYDTGLSKNSEQKGLAALEDAVAYTEKQINAKRQGVAEGLTLNQQFDIIEEMVNQLALEHGVDADVIWEDFDSVDDDTLVETAAWHRKEGKNKKGGLNAKGVASYRKEHPGSKLQTAVTTPPSKLKPGSKAAKRRKSFCARMGGIKGPMKDEHGEPTRKALALRKWNC